MLKKKNVQTDLFVGNLLFISNLFRERSRVCSLVHCHQTGFGSTVRRLLDRFKSRSEAAQALRKQIERK